MPKITYIDSSGNKKIIEVSKGLSVMEGAVQNNVPGIDADCGGGMACATCHLVVNQNWYNILPRPSIDESDMLELANGLTPTSRLGCQIEITEELNGLILSVP